MADIKEMAAKEGRLEANPFFVEAACLLLFSTGLCVVLCQAKEPGPMEGQSSQSMKQWLVYSSGSDHVCNLYPSRFPISVGGHPCVRLAAAAIC